jgi:predicted PurR-regulated permease PerM
MRGFLIGCGVVALLLVGGLVAGGFFLWNWAAPQVTQGINTINRLQGEIQRLVPGIGNFSWNINTVNGNTVARISASVPFDPTVGDQPARVANEILRAVRQTVPANLLPAKTLEVRLYRSTDSAGSSTTQQRTFRFDLTQPLPPVTPPRS